MTCKTHPDAPHRFVRGASHSEDMYVCECEFWEEPKMNERIKKLAEQAGFKVNWQHEDVQAIKMARFEKFAELIIRECAEQSMSIGRHNTPSGITPDLAIAIAVGLKKHFGVKE